MMQDRTDYCPLWEVPFWVVYLLKKSEFLSNITQVWVILESFIATILGVLIIKNKHMILTSCFFFLTLREYMPTLEEFFEEAIEQADPENMVENEYK